MQLIERHWDLIRSVQHIRSCADTYVQRGGGYTEGSVKIL